MCDFIHTRAHNNDNTTNAGIPFSAAAHWAARNAMAMMSSLCLWPCLLLAVVLLATHTWMATSSLTSYECLKGGGRGSDSLSYLEVRGVAKTISVCLAFCLSYDCICWYSLLRSVSSVLAGFSVTWWWCVLCGTSRYSSARLLDCFVVCC